MNVTYTTYARFADVFGRSGSLDLPVPATLQDALNTLCGEDQTKKDHLFERDGSIRKYVILMVNRERMAQEDMDIPLSDGDEIILYPPVSGG